ncbi:nucleotidyltransferase family protein [Methanospirillum sp.]|uniref:nucleotidyltransferase family protein n=1 Tax=Methanospirillum sp. TaxID=45200 RepID=UPI0035A00610
MSKKSGTSGNLIEILTSKRDELKALVLKHGASNIRIFGSVARREETPGSDIDLLVDMNEDASLLDLARLKNDLEDLLGTPIDITTRPALHPMLADAILKEAIAL